MIHCEEKIVEKPVHESPFPLNKEAVMLIFRTSKTETKIFL